MKKIFTSLALCALLINAFAQQTQMTQEEMQKVMQNMMPGKMHSMMAESVGDWKAITKIWMDPTQPPMESTATVKSEMIMGGRYLCSKWNGNMMGMPFEGLSTTAYDNGTGNFYASWIDNMSTGMMLMTGTMDKETKTIEYKGITQDSMTGKEMKVRQEITFIDKNTQKMVMYMDYNGQEMKTMEIMMTRVM
jgi:hypothetical protein